MMNVKNHAVAACEHSIGKTRCPKLACIRLFYCLMRGNHVVWGRVHEPIPDATTAEDRERIAGVELRPMVGYSKYNSEVWKNGSRLGYVRVRADGQYYRVAGSREWLFAGHEWSASDPHWGLAILALLDQ